MKRLGFPILPALLMAGTGIGTTASALEIGEIEIQSKLGQPLRASIAYALAPNEVIGDYCVSLAPAAPSSGVPLVDQARIRVADGVITLTGKTPLREPLMSARLSVSCPYTPRITRDYMFFLDPVEVPAETRFATAPATPATQAPALDAQTIAPTRPERQAPAAPVATGSTYRAQPGDTLSEIASRLEGRQVGLWPAVMAIFEANPGAFIDDDPNQLKAGSLLEIPLSAAVGGVAASAPASPSPVREVAATSERLAEAPVEAVAAADDTAYLEPASTTVYEPVFERVSTMPTEDTPQVGDTTIDDAQEPAEAIIESPVAADDVAIVDEVVEPETPVPAESVIAPAASPAADSVVAPTAIESTTSTDSSYGVWWTLGGALALIVGIFAWRRRKSQDTEHAPLVEAPAPHPLRRITDEDSIEVRVIENVDDAAGIDFDLSDDSPTEENLALDADLFEGRGLSETPESGNADFGFAETTDLDLEITEAAAREPEDPETDIIPPPERTSTGSILESEVLPEDHDYDMSVIMDATKMPEPAEATERDLKAVVVHDSEKSLDAEGYTLSKEVDFEMLEQDYEEEMTATQALNMEIEKAARELASNLEEKGQSEPGSNEETTALPIASVTELDVTSSMLAGNDDIISDLDDTTVNEALTIDFSNEGDASADITAELTANIEAQEKTAELEQADDAGSEDESEDATAEMEIKSGRAG